jgi:hypothetical protein
MDTGLARSVALLGVCSWLAACRAGYAPPDDDLDAVVLYQMNGTGPVVALGDESNRAPNVSLTGTDGVDYDGTGGITFSGEAPRLRASAGVSRELAERLLAAGSIAVEIWAATADVGQAGPARLVTLSTDQRTRAFMVGQQQGAVVFRVQSTVTDPSGTTFQNEPGAFPDLEPHHIVAVFDAESAAQLVYVDGFLASERRHLSDEGIEGVLSWDPDVVLGLGDEVSGSRAWNGTLFKVAVFDRAMSAGEVAARFASGP